MQPKINLEKKDRGPKIGEYLCKTQLLQTSFMQIAIIGGLLTRFFAHDQFEVGFFVWKICIQQSMDQSLLIVSDNCLYFTPFDEKIVASEILSLNLSFGR
jgi:hypothetical protein